MYFCKIKKYFFIKIIILIVFQKLYFLKLTLPNIDLNLWKWNKLKDKSRHNTLI